ncbi:MAG: bifunctional (p)ppGpp synthetase/guanosine-3',5'-bis(diphosphate) 3'-pyrophosphohydrolase [Pseudomonadota bacterium]|nr:bifunctional (p)ppGpp synthetase/guanosine-3',5'-bis(diphosphate) 3'-pyrophosphohydrolase [Pseudomonadota bacterium]
MAAQLNDRLLISDLCDLIAHYLPPHQVNEVYRAYLFSAEAHEGQTRRSGEPYIFHPIAVTYILGQMRMDVQTLCAALLHDVIEDTGVSKETLINEFGEQVAELVDGVSKLSSIQFETREQAEAASFRKMLLAMNRDIRVIIVKLADRLHNMRTLKVMKPTSRRRIARETLDIYAPIASRLGINTVRVELEELCFATLYPLRYTVLATRLRKVVQQRSDVIQNIQTTLEHGLSRQHIQAQVFKRTKHFYGLYTKMREKKGLSSQDRRKSFQQVTNSCAFRIIVDNISACYQALGIVHSLYKPMCEHFKDYIAIPKINGYQSLHTLLFTSHGLLVEIQIRTQAMHEFSETGITAFDFSQINQELQKQSSAVHKRASEWVHGLLDIQKNSKDALEFFEHVKVDLFSDEVYVFTPHGKIMQLPKGATAIDFAYAIHTDVGNQCIAVKIDQQYAPLSTQLKSGQTVEVITAHGARPSPSWLNFAVTGRARSQIRHILKNLEYNEAIVLGKRLLNKELSAYALSVDELTEKQKKCLLKTFNIEQFNTLLADIGLGNRFALLVARQFEVAESILPQHHNHQDSPNPLIIKGTDGILVNFSRCCRPIPGDDIVGFISTGRGLLIHTTTCKHVAEYRHQPDKLLLVQWESGIEGEFLVNICVEVRDQRGVLATVASALTNMGSNIEYVANENNENFSSTLKFCISVRHRDHLAAIVRHLRRLDVVTHIRRSKN